MSTFTQYLTESAKQYDYKIKIAGDLEENFATKLETALNKFDLANLSSGKSYPIQQTPLDFPQFNNVQVTIFDATTNYPASVFEMSEYLANYLNLAKNQIVVRKPGEPTEEYQADMTIAKEITEFESVLQDVEYKDAPKIKADEVYGDKANQSLLKELLKDRQENKDHPKGGETGVQSHIEEKGTPSPLSKPSNPHPDPKRK